jgi:hypothetical protein
MNESFVHAMGLHDCIRGSCVACAIDAFVYVMDRLVTTIVSSPATEKPPREAAVFFFFLS